MNIFTLFIVSVEITTNLLVPLASHSICDCLIRVHKELSSPHRPSRRRNVIASQKCPGAFHISQPAYLHSQAQHIYSALFYVSYTFNFPTISNRISTSSGSFKAPREETAFMCWKQKISVVFGVSTLAPPTKEKSHEKL